MFISSSTPRADGFIMPAEWETHEQTWIVWPENLDVWCDNAHPGQKAFAKVITAISQFEKVKVIVSAEQQSNCRKYFDRSSNVDFVVLPTDDSWVRDTGPTFVINRATGIVRAVKWQFNSWGGLLSSCQNDNEVGVKIAETEGVSYYKCDIVMEPGSYHVDGQGTLLTTEECLLNKNRNPTLSKQQIEDYLKEYLNVQKVIWLSQGTYLDTDTNGHVDNFCCFARPGEVILNWTDDVDDPQHEISQRAYDILSNSTDAKGNRFTVHKLHQPTPIHSGEKIMGVCKPRGERLPANYVNFYLANSCLIMPGFNDDVYDKLAREQLSRIFPDRQIVQIYALDILLGGGIIHCITQQQPKGLLQI